MAPKLSDPNTFLTNLVTKKGISDLYGVYLTGVNVAASATENYDYEVSLDRIERDLQNIFTHESDDWNALLVEVRRDEEIVYPISFLRGREPNTIYFISEGNKMSAMVFIPTLLVEEFIIEVTFYQHLLREVAKFAGKSASTIRFTLGSVSMEWEEVVERGCAREVDVCF